MTADAWARFTTRGTLHFLGAGDRTGEVLARLAARGDAREVDGRWTPT